MAKLTSKQLLWIRNIVMFAGVLMAFVVWLHVPSTLKNNRLYHIGNGEYTFKEPFLIFILMPLLGLIPRKPIDEIHTDDMTERNKIKEEIEITSKKTQIICTVIGTLLACVIFLLMVLIG